MNSEADTTSDGISAELRREIRKEAVSQVAKWSIAAFVLFFGIAASGWWFYLEAKLSAYIADKAGALPPGAVIAVDDRHGCESLGERWVDAGFSGKFIVGAERNHRTWNYAQSGGDIAVVLEAKHMPQIYIATDPFLFGSHTTKFAVQSIGFVKPTTQHFIVGGNEKPESVQTLPPYVALFWCRRRNNP